jgi:hypothetical protein
MSLFDSAPLAAADKKRPLAERMRPQRLEDYAGQTHILGPGKPLRVQIERDELQSLILWGPPGVGKTTLAQLVARMTRCEFIPFSAVMSGIKEIKAVMLDAERIRKTGRRTVLFVDEIHRFNKAQQDAFLPYVERGDVILIGATTENPPRSMHSRHSPKRRSSASWSEPCPWSASPLRPRSWPRSRSIPTEMRGPPTTSWNSPLVWRREGPSSQRLWKTSLAARCCSTTRRARNTIT